LDLYYNVAKGLIDVSDIRRFKEYLDQKKPERVIEQKSPTVAPAKTTISDKETLLIGDNMAKIDYSFAKCCNPIPGDDVFGFVTVSEGIKIHRTNCPNAVELVSNYGYRVIKAKWTSQKELAFLTSLNIIGTDRLGIVNDVTKVISSELKVNIRSITINSNDGMFEGNMMVFVNDTSQLDTLIAKLSAVPDIVSVSRESI